MSRRDKDLLNQKIAETWPSYYEDYRECDLDFAGNTDDAIDMAIETRGQDVDLRITYSYGDFCGLFKVEYFRGEKVLVSVSNLSPLPQIICEAALLLHDLDKSL